MIVLDPNIMTEAPDACSLISQALNKGQAMGVGTVDTTAIACLSRQLSHTRNASFASAEQQNRFQKVKDALRQELDDFVDHEHFVGLFDFVVNVVGDRSPHLPKLLEFVHT